ncbi:hypothetical protein TWF730_003827 [Orbilia blumenaviensis]|uniref:Oxysterol-binding protein n=1 Tax=Orbilia blumenaviensis TaxID=1796055 RepID=A0AAV9U4P2_9PEZI
MKFIPSFSLLSSDNQALRNFLYYLPSVDSDLSTISAPTPLLLPKSIVEYPAMVALHHKLFLQPTSQPSSLDRAVSIFKNYICTLRVQANGCRIAKVDGPAGEMGNGLPLKKPLNPVLGETFLASVRGNGCDETTIICEQVSHHPPVTASYIVNQRKGISVQAYLGQITNFTPMNGGITINQNGHAFTHIRKYNEYHLATFPAISIRGLWKFGGSEQNLGYSGESQIVSSSGLITDITFREVNTNGKGIFGFRSASSSRSGSGREVEAKISRWHETEGGKRSIEKEPLVTIVGSWDGSLTIRYMTSGKQEVFVIEQTPMADIYTSEGNQTQWNSQKVWGATKEALEKNDWKRAAEEKRKVEEWQRGLRRQEELEGKQWVPKYFKLMESCTITEYLAKVSNRPLKNTYEQGGMWRCIRSA